MSLVWCVCSNCCLSEGARTSRPGGTGRPGVNVPKTVNVEVVRRASFVELLHERVECRSVLVDRGAAAPAGPALGRWPSHGDEVSRREETQVEVVDSEVSWPREATEHGRPVTLRAASVFPRLSRRAQRRDLHVGRTSRPDPPSSSHAGAFSPVVTVVICWNYSIIHIWRVASIAGPGFSPVDCLLRG